MKDPTNIENFTLQIRPLIPVILCGGTGTRLWPLSRASYPKQYWNLTGKKDHSLLQKTQLRLKNLEEIKKPILICNEDHRFIVAEQMRQINIDANSIILEPIGRNTAPAIAIAALKASEEEEDPLLLVLAADHEIQQTKKFHTVINAAREYAEQDRLITFGIVPTSPETGYGYIKSKSYIDQSELKGFDIAKFVEKPNKETAEQFIKDKRFTWNSGMFLFKASVILKEIEKLEPNILKHCKASLKKGKKDLDFFRLNQESFKNCPKLAIDVAIMEKTNVGTVIPLDAGWSDVGNWKNLWITGEKDSEGNVIEGNVMTKDSSNCYLRSENRLVVGMGINNLAIIETDDAILISDINETQKVKDIVEQLEKQSATEGITHRKIYRPWGNYSCVEQGKNWQVKRIEVNPGGSLSLQMHNHRAEHWVVVKGTALIEKDNEKEILEKNKSTYIPIGCKHRLSNPGTIPVELIEVQSGDYLGEDDIIRYEDIYGRLENNAIS